MTKISAIQGWHLAVSVECTLSRKDRVCAITIENKDREIGLSWFRVSIIGGSQSHCHQ
jgi:hypothetical protein